MLKWPVPSAPQSLSQRGRYIHRPGHDPDELADLHDREPPPIAAFVAAGFEHSVANMHFISIGLLIKTDEAFVASRDPAPDLSGLTWGGFFADNLVPVTIGNVIGGSVMVGAVYRFVYLRRRAPQAAGETSSADTDR